MHVLIAGWISLNWFQKTHLLLKTKSSDSFKKPIGLNGEINETMDATTMRALVAYIAELRRNREYHRTIEHATGNTKEEPVHNRSQGHRSGDGGFDPHSAGQGGHNL
jgi:hypothetical protein